MSNEKIRNLLGRLHDELKVTSVDDETRSMIEELDADIDDLLNPATESDDSSSILERARKLEAEFASEYPSAAGVVRDIVDLFGKMGI